MKNILFALILLPTILFGQSKPLTYYLPDIPYDTEIPTPESVLGYQVGDWHVSHDQLVNYMKVLAKSSNRVRFTEYARSHENRPLIYLTITSTKNQNDIQKIQQRHYNLTDPEKSNDVNISSTPAVVYQGYSIHGNESSGANASMLAAYYLAAGQSNEVKEILENVVVLIDPAMNPDGLNRFANWVNMHKSKNEVTDPNSREFNEVWPGGRTNHYWFDLNRDWLLAQHPESQGRLKTFHKWKPNVLTDHHEMGSDNTFFFQPGIPSRTNPLTPQKNQDLTGEIATYHAAALDQIGSLYYSKESFDDFYYGKGSTYPDINGAVGILFEQASSRGHKRKTANGMMDFPFTIRNQVITSLSTQKAAMEMKDELLTYQRDFYKNAQKELSEKKAAYLFSSNDKSAVRIFAKFLQQHDIDVYQLKEDVTENDIEFSKADSYIVPNNQKQSRLIHTIFEKNTSFNDSLFYDVSAWTLPLAYNLSYTVVDDLTVQGDLLKDFETDASIDIPKSEIAYLVNWSDYYAPKVANQLLQNGIKVKVATKAFKVKANGVATSFQPGTLQIPSNNQAIASDKIHEIIQSIGAESGIQIHSVSSGLSLEGIDIGSPSHDQLKAPKVCMLVGDGVNVYDAGEVWHLLDTRYAMQVTMLDKKEVGSVNLKNYNVIVMVDGYYGDLSDTEVIKMKQAISGGATLIAMKRAASWAGSNGLANIKQKKLAEEKPKKHHRHAYCDLAANNGAKYIGGAIFETKLDLSHPLAFGYDRDLLPVFRRGTLFFEVSKNAYASPLVYTDQPLLSGYISKDNLKALSNSASIVVSSVSKGKVICMADNPNFRGYWYGTNRLFANALFFGDLISGRATERVK